MSFGLARGRSLETDGFAVSASDLPPLPDDVLDRPESAWCDPRQWFDNPTAPLEIEVGSGKGTFLVGAANAAPGVNFLGIEWAREFAMFAADRLRRHALSNVRMLHADATEFLRWRTPTGCARVVHLYFSDPWPKPRHHKRRVLQDAFLQTVHRVLAPDGQLRIVTDHTDYWSWMEEHFDRWCAAGRLGPRYERREFTEADRPVGAGEGEIVGTNFERKYAREGRPFHATVLVRRDASVP
jgi:tRNA (guanine-N7-)-methyltransferase